MKTTRTIISFINFQDIENDIFNQLHEKHLNYGVSHSSGVTTLIVNGRIEKEDLGYLSDNLNTIYYEDTYDSMVQDNPDDIVECMSHCLSGLLDI